jgi:hypothetical protein
MALAANSRRETPTPPSVRFPVQPRMLPPMKVARWLHLSLDELRASLPALWAEGFPKPCSVTGNYDLRAIEVWQDRRSGLAGASAVSAQTSADIAKARLATLG